VPAPLSYWIVLAAGSAAVLFFYWVFDFARLEIFKMLLGSFFPLAILILAGARLDRLRPGHADRGGGRRLPGRHPAGGGLRPAQPGRA
jgi:hypothetical protein